MSASQQWPDPKLIASVVRLFVYEFEPLVRRTTVERIRERIYGGLDRMRQTNPPVAFDMNDVLLLLDEVAEQSPASRGGPEDPGIYGSTPDGYATWRPSEKEA